MRRKYIITEEDVNLEVWDNDINTYRNVNLINNILHQLCKSRVPFQKIFKNALKIKSIKKFNSYA